MKNPLTVSDQTVGKILFIMDDNGRDSKYEEAFKMWKMEITIEHVPYRGLQNALENTYDIVIVDDYLTNKSGYTLAMEILSKKNLVMYMLGRDMDDVSVVGAFRIGITDYISADVSPIQLAARCISEINRGLFRTQNVVHYTDGRISVSDLTLDTRNCVVEIGERRILLLKMESEILQVLMEHPDNILSKKEIYEKAWNAAYIDGENTVATHISKIRKKIEEDEDSPKYIETKWGVGYRFISHPQNRAYC